MNDEIKDLIQLIGELEVLRELHTITYEGLHKVTELMQDFAWETRTHYPLNRRDESNAKLERVEQELMRWEIRGKDDLVTLSVGAIKNLLSYIKGEM